MKNLYRHKVGDLIAHFDAKCFDDCAIIVEIVKGKWKTSETYIVKRFKDSSLFHLGYAQICDGKRAYQKMIDKHKPKKDNDD